MSRSALIGVAGGALSRSTRRLVGDDFFRAMAGAFVAAEKPRSPVLIHYGAGFPDFVAGFAPARRDRLSRRRRAARERLGRGLSRRRGRARSRLDALGGDRARAISTALRFPPHPAARLLRFAHPAASIWAASQGEGEPRAPEDWSAEDALVARPDADVFVRVLPPGGFDFAAALFAGATLGEAAALAAVDGFDPGAHLVGLIEAGAFQSLISKEP